MSKIELDDQILDHPKFVRAVKLGGSDAVFLWLGLRAYCAKLLTDGFVPDDMIDEVRGPKDAKRRAVALQSLRDSGLVDDRDNGVMLHDYLDWASSREDVLRWRAKAKERQAKSRGSSRVCSTVTDGEQTTLSHGMSQRDSECDGERDYGVTDGVTTPLLQCSAHARATRVRVAPPSPSQSSSRISDQIPPNPPSTLTDEPQRVTRDPNRPKPADPFRASFKTQCPDRLEFTEKHRGLAKRGSIDINLSWTKFRANSNASSRHCVDWGAAFEAELAKSIENIERSAAYRANGVDTPPTKLAATVARDQPVEATPVAPPTTEAHPGATVADLPKRRNVSALLVGIG